MILKGAFLLYTAIFIVPAISYANIRNKQLSVESQSENSKIFEDTEELENQEKFRITEEFENSKDFETEQESEYAKEFENGQEFNNAKELDESQELETKESKAFEINNKIEENALRKSKFMLNMEGELFRKLFIETFMIHQQANVICSPVAAYLPLGKLVLATNNESSQTFKQLANVLGLARIADVRKTYKSLLKSLKTIPGVTLDIASRIYVTHSKEIKESYTNTLLEIFDSSVEPADFEDTENQANITNTWVLHNTHSQVKEMLVPLELSETDELVIVNAVYFTGIWKYKFETSFMDLFHTPHGDYRVLMMRNNQRVAHSKCHTLNSQVANISFKDKDASMLIILPNNKGGLPILMHILKSNPAALQTCLSAMNIKDMHISIPRFNIQSEIDLKEVYQSIGLKNVFNEDESGLDDMIEREGDDSDSGRISVSKILSKVVVDVNETGLRRPVFFTKSMEEHYQFSEFKANRPFMYIITAKKLQLLAGVIRDLRRPNL